MPPKIRITRNDIINKTIEIIRENGIEAVNARSIAKALNCSTQPIFSNFASMEDLQNEVLSSAYGVYRSFLEKEVKDEKYPKYKAFGMAYIRFAKEEKELFKFLFMRDRSEEDLSPSPDFEESVQMIMKANDLTHERAMLFHLELWSCVHGIGTMLATSFLPLEWDRISDMISDMYKGLVARHTLEDKQ